jgi:adenylate kinase family enzyme
VQRIIIVGNSGSGKSTLATKLAERLDIPYIETDSIFHQPGWKEIDSKLFRERLDALTQSHSWVLDGNYLRFTREIVWPRADTIVWLDYHFVRVVTQVTRRTFLRLFRGTELWNGNRETWRMAFSRQSIILWSIDMHYHYRKQFDKLLSSEAVDGKTVVQLKSPRETVAWLNDL